MSCASFDWKGYALGEATADERRAMEQHLPTCAGCRQELDRLGFVRSALMSVRDEEIPRRIAFVSDKVFEPRWYQKLWASGPVAGFASAAVLAGAILAHGFMQQPVAPVAAPVISQAEIESRVQTEVDRRLEAVVTKAVTSLSDQQAKIIANRMAGVEKKVNDELTYDRASFRANFEYLDKRITRYMKEGNQVANASFGIRP